MSDFDFNLTNIVTLTQSMLEQLTYFDSEEDIIKANFTEGGKYPIIVITGENAMGKSFVRRLYQVVFNKYSTIECIHISQQGRSSSGIMKAFIYGAEDYESTGQITCRTILGGINTCNSRENEHTIIWDEPDIGLSDSYAAGVGVKIREFVENLPKLTFGVIVITHSKYLVKQLLPLNPHYLRIGDNKSLENFLKERVKPKNIQELEDRALETFRKISKMMKN